MPNDTTTTTRVSGLDRRRFVKTTGATIAGLSAAGCQGTSPGEESDGNGATAGDTTGQSLGRDTLRIGVLAPEPEGHIFGRSIVNSTKLAVDEVNENGGVLGAEIELLVRDTQFEPHTSRKEHQALVVEEDVDLTIGPMFTASLLQMMQSVAEQETLAFAAGSAGADIPGIIADNYDRFKYVFRPTAVNLPLAVPAHIEFLMDVGPELGWEKIALIDESQVVLDEFHNPVKETLPEQYELTMAERVSGVTNWTPIFDQVEQTGADLFLSHVLFMGQTMIKQWADQQRDFELGGLNLFGTAPDFYEQLDGSPRYTWTADYVVPGSGNTEHTDPFFNALEERFGEATTYAGPLAYDDVKIYAKAVRETGTTDEETLIDYLENDLVYTQSPMLPRVEIYDADGEYPHDPVYTGYEEMNCPVITQWHENEAQDGTGKQTVIFPDDQQNGQYKKPPWI